MAKTTVLKSTPRQYDIYIDEGLIDTPPKALKALLEEKSNIIIVTDENIEPLYMQRLKVGLEKSHKTICHEIIIEAGEGTKSFLQLQQLCEKMASLGVARDSLIIALGGGVVGDLTGFASAIMLRGIDFIQIPTSLLAMVDSSVGGKTGINILGGKNLVGAFHQPRMVLQDITILSTLPKRQMKAGYAEIVKYALIDDPPFFQWLKTNGRAVIEGDKQALITAINKSCEAKARIVDEDERESGKRMLLNLGHSFGHALEAAMGYNDRLLHGEAVAIGMNMAFQFSQRQGFCDDHECNEVISHFEELNLPLWPKDIASLSDGAAITDLDAPNLTDYMRHDKKVKQGKLTLILSRGIGKAFMNADHDLKTIEDFWFEILAQ